MKIFSTLVFLTLLVSSALAQLAELKQTDSLKHQLQIARHDTTRVLILAALAEAYRYRIPDSALLHGQRSLSLAKQIKFSKGEVSALLSISVVMRELGNFPKALETALKALQIAHDNNYTFKEELSLLRIANVHVASKNFRTALTYYGQAEKLLKLFPNDFYLAVLQVWSGLAYEELNVLDSALYYEQLASRKIAKYETLPPLYFRVLGNIQAKSGNSDHALQYYQQGIQSVLKNNNYRDAAPLYISIASLYKKLNQPDSAIHYAKQGLAYGQLLNYKIRIMDASKLLAELYEQKDIKTSLQYYKMANAAKDSMYSVEQVQALQSIAYNEQERKRETEATKAAYQDNIRQFALLTGLGVFLIIALILYRNNRYKQKANIHLKEQKEEIQNTLNELRSTQSLLIQSEKMASLGELTAGIAHEIQNPLNFVNNFSDVNRELLNELDQEMEKGNFGDAKAIAKDVIKNEEKINHHGKRADAIVRSMLQHSRSSSGVKELADINALVDEYVRLAYHGFRAKDKTFNATIKINLDKTIVNINIIPQEIGRVILNLINNAFYAVSAKASDCAKASSDKSAAADDRYEPTVAVSTKKIGDIIEIRVVDNGNGISPKILDKIFQPFFSTKPTGQGTGLGLSLSYDIIKAHRGELNVETKEGEVAEFIVKLPIT